ENSFRHRALGYFLHSDRVRRQTAGGFLQTSLSKILGNRLHGVQSDIARLGFPMNARGYTATDLHCSIIPSDIMALTIGTQLGSHEITALLGRGGMGEVYRARDLKLKREVAIKVLPEEFARDTDRVARFQREAEVLASLNHPNIAGIHELAEANGSRFLVLE